MSMRKWLSLILIVSLLASLFGGCNFNSGDQPKTITGEIVDSYVGEEVELEQQPFSEEAIVETYELAEDANAIEDAQAEWAEGVVFISDRIANKILAAEKGTNDSIITITEDVEIFAIDEVLVYTEELIAYRVVEKEEALPVVNYTLVRAELEEIFAEIEIADQTVMLNHENLAFVGEGVVAEKITSSIIHKFEVNHSFFDNMIRVSGDVEFMNPSITTRMGSNGYELAFTAKESANLKVEGELKIDRELRFIIAAYAFDIKVSGKTIGQAAVGVFLAVDVKGNIHFIYEIDQSYELKVGVRGKTAKIPFTSIYFPTSASTFYEMNQKFEVTPPTLTGELTVRIGVLATAQLTIYNKNIINFNILMAIEGIAQFQLKQGDSFLKLAIDVLLLIDGDVMTVKIKWGWRPKIVFPMKSFQLLYQRWNIYIFETSEQPPLGKIPILTVDSNGANDVIIASTTDHGGSALYTLPISEPNTEVHLEAPEVVGSGLIQRYFSHWSGDVESDERSISFTMDENMNVTANYGDLYSSFGDLPPIGLQDYTLSVNSSGAADVSIASTTDHGGTTNYQLTGLNESSEIHLEAPEYVDSGQDRKRFSAWSGAVSSKSRGITVSMKADQAVTANYVADPAAEESYTLRVSSLGTAKVPISSSNGGGTTNYVKTLAPGTKVTLEAPIYVGSGEDQKSFSGWSGAVSSKDRVITVTMNADQSVTANYDADPEREKIHYLSVSSQGVANVPIISDTGVGGTTNYEIGIRGPEVHHLEAPEYVGSDQDRKRFSEWLGAASSKDRAITITMTADKAVTAHYVADPLVEYTLKVYGNNYAWGWHLLVSSPTGHGGEVLPDRDFYYELRVEAGTLVTLVAPENDAYRFYRWTDNADGKGNVLSINPTYTFTMDSHKTVYAFYDY
ncbi:MAG: hypothetical protein NUK65_01475 [Firmicutes bacterium]|nr:hypothetical protein [Bacillota bacterium]